MEEIGDIELMKDLRLAQKILSEYKGGYSNEFSSVEEFHKALSDTIDELESGNQTDLTKIWRWFAPTTAWDDFVGEKGSELGNRIFERVDRLKNAKG